MKKRHPFGRKAIKTLNIFDLMGKAFTVNEKNYVPLQIDIFEKGIVIECNVGKGDENELTKETIISSFAGNDRLEPIEVNGRTIFWDKVDEVFRWNPEKPATQCDNINKWITIWDNGEMRVEKEYAEHNMSPEALEYAFFKGDEYYSWNLDDYSFAPVLYELSSQFSKFLNSETLIDPNANNVINYVCFYTSSYCELLDCKTPEEHLEKYKTYYYKKLWEAEKI